MQKNSEHSPDAGEPVVERRTAFLAIAGCAAGVLVGVPIGLAHGYGRFTIPGLAPLNAAGAAVPAFVAGVVLAACFGLAGGLVGIGSAAKGHAAHHRASRVLRLLPAIGFAATVVFTFFTLWVIASRALGSGAFSDQSNRVTWNQKNTIRVGDSDDAHTAILARQVAFAAGAPKIEIAVPNDWRFALAATPLISRPSDGVIQIGGGAPGDPAEFAASIDERAGSAGGGLSNAVILVSGESDAQWSLPAGAYAARTGVPILFVGRNGVPASTAAALQKRGGHGLSVVLGPATIISEATLDALRRFGRVVRVSGSDPIDNAVRFSEFYDAASQFGWGQNGRLGTQYVSTSTILVNPAKWQDAIAAVHLARGGKSGALLFTHAEQLPRAVENHLWRVRPVFGNTPAEGPFNNVWVVGSFSAIHYAVQAWADYSQEIEQYMSLGDTAVSGFEALTIGWLAIGMAIAIWIFVHSKKRITAMMPMMRFAWSLFGFLLGPIALLLYIQSYHRVPAMKHDGMTMWHRSLWGETVSATVMMFAFDMALMVLAVFAIGYLGFPLVTMRSDIYWVGTSMFLMMILMYVVALIAMMLFFHTPMTMHERKIDSYAKAFVAGLPMMLVTMTAESFGMMPAMWWAQMHFLPAMQMPTSDDLTMWGTLLLAVMAGFLVVLPFNGWMVARGMKVGRM